jgi:hypothetical protein
VYCVLRSQSRKGRRPQALRLAANKTGSLFRVTAAALLRGAKNSLKNLKKNLKRC